MSLPIVDHSSSLRTLPHDLRATTSAVMRGLAATDGLGAPDARIASAAGAPGAPSPVPFDVIVSCADGNDSTSPDVAERSGPSSR